MGVGWGWEMRGAGANRISMRLECRRSHGSTSIAVHQCRACPVKIPVALDSLSDDVLGGGHDVSTAGRKTGSVLNLHVEAGRRLTRDVEYCDMLVGLHVGRREHPKIGLRWRWGAATWAGVSNPNVGWRDGLSHTSRPGAGVRSRRAGAFHLLTFRRSGLVSSSFV